jgi:hypothetical protein
MTASQKTTRPDMPGGRPLSPAGLWRLAGISILIFALLFAILLAILTGFEQRSRLGVVLTMPSTSTPVLVPLEKDGTRTVLRLDDINIQLCYHRIRVQPDS